MINNIFIKLNEPLPECEAQIKNEANKQNMLTATRNCAVFVLVENGRKKSKICPNEHYGRFGQMNSLACMRLNF